MRGFVSVNQMCPKKRLILIVVSYSATQFLFPTHIAKQCDVATKQKQKQKPQHLHPEQAKTSKTKYNNNNNNIMKNKKEEEKRLNCARLIFEWIFRTFTKTPTVYRQTCPRTANCCCFLAFVFCAFRG